jgi:PAS domain S-box-containing protein
VILFISAGLMIALVVLIAIWLASTFTQSITHLINGISRFRAGERYFRFNAPVKDEIGTLADSFDEMADSLVESDQGPLVIINSDFKVIYVNDAGLEAVNRTREDVRGIPYSDISVYPANSVYDPITALREGKEAEVLYLTETEKYYKGSATYLTDKDGKNIGYFVISQDVTELVEQQKKTEEQKDLLDLIFASSPDLIWYQDIRGKILALNPRYASVYGKSPEDLTGVNQMDLVPPEHQKIYADQIRSVVEARKATYFEDHFYFADGHKEILDMVLTPIIDEFGKLTGILGFARDVSARVLMDEELRHTQTQLEKAVDDANRANEHKGDFLARMSHEIRTPMNAIIGMTGIVKKKLLEPNPDQDEIQANIRQIEASSQHLLGLLNDILDISKIEAGKIELTEELLDLPKLVNTVTTIIQPRCDEKGITFNVHTNIPAPATYSGDALRLRQVLINLLGNAVKFTPELGVIEFSAELKERRANETTENIEFRNEALLAFSVKDTGIGISEEAIANLFKPFEQANNQISKKFGGTGLGLAISRSIVQLFGGDITVTSNEGKGSEFAFEIWLPETRDDQAQDLEHLDATDLFKGKKALLVDDVDINRIIAMNMLEYTGIDIVEAEDGVEAVKAFTDSAPFTYDIIYMDVQMPNMNGYEASTAIRALDRKDAKTVPIVALTANAFKEDIDKALQSGMNAHLAKPMDLEKVLEVSFRLMGVGK